MKLINDKDLGKTGNFKDYTKEFKSKMGAYNPSLKEDKQNHRIPRAGHLVQAQLNT